MSGEPDSALARKGRIAAVVIAASGLLAILAPWLTAALGLPLRFEFLFYLAAMAGFVWALVVSLQIWRARDR
jgi:hypothetical protein